MIDHSFQVGTAPRHGGKLPWGLGYEENQARDPPKLWNKGETFEGP